MTEHHSGTVETPFGAWRLRWAIALVLGVSALNLLVGRIVRGLAGAHLGSAGVSLGLLATFATLYVVELGIVASVIHHAGGRSREWLRLGPKLADGTWFAAAVLAAMAARAFATAYTALMLAQGWRLHGWDSDPTRFFPRTFLGSAVLVLVVVFAAPIAEEIVFRGVLFPSLVARIGEGWAIAVTSVIFAALHLNTFAFLPILMVGVMLAYLYRRSGSLRVSILAHASFNALGILVVLVLRSQGAM